MCGAATCDLNHIIASCTHFGERPRVDDIAEMKNGYVRWLTAVADTVMMIDTVAPSSDHYCIGIVVPSSDHCCIGTVRHLVIITEL